MSICGWLLVVAAFGVLVGAALGWVDSDEMGVKK